MDLFRRKSVTALQAEAASDHSLKRALGPLNLTALGIGAIIGTGIFVLTGTVAAQNAGPAVVLSFVLAGVASIFAALCYSEFASLVPMAGSAYTYGYATLGEFVAWIIGWDLVLEYALARHHGGDRLVGLRGLVPATISAFTSRRSLAGAPGGTVGRRLADGDAHGARRLLQPAGGDHRRRWSPRCWWSASRSRPTSTTSSSSSRSPSCCCSSCSAVRTSNPANWHPFIPPNTAHRRALRLQRHRGRARGSSSSPTSDSTPSHGGAGGQESAARHADRHHRLAADLHRALHHRRARSRPAWCHYTRAQRARSDRQGGRCRRARLDLRLIKLGAIAGLSSVMLVQLLGQSRIFYAMSRDGLLPPFVAGCIRRFRTP